MSIEEVRGFRYKCDACGSEHLQENATGHYTNSTPPGWSTIKIMRADAPSVTRLDVDMLICVSCGNSIIGRSGILQYVPTQAEPA